MSKIVLKGGHRLHGEVKVQGAKNSALPLLAASFLINGESIIHNCPDISDVDATMKILISLGSKAERKGSTVIVNSSSADGFEISEALMREMRSSIIFLGAIVGRVKKARLSFPGGCELGPRPIDLHLSALEKMGVSITENHGYIDCEAKNGLVGTDIMLSFPSVGATENIMLAAVTAKGKTVIHNAAREPEISDVADFLNGCGARISGAGESTVYIEGVEKLYGREHRVIPDRIVASTYLAAAAVTGGEITLSDVIPADLSTVSSAFCEAGCEIAIGNREMRIIAPGRLRRVRTVRTLPYPGFPTDATAPFMAVMTLAEGTTMFVENIFSNRYNYTSELVRMGAKIKVEERVAVVEGVRKLHGASVKSTDLRGAAAMVIAGLNAEGETILDSTAHIDRGYENFEKFLSALGADIKRI